MVDDPETGSTQEKVIFDLDSTVLTLYGKQAFAAMGYNPAKKRRLSYHPRLGFNGITKEYWHGELRPGNTQTSTRVLEVLRESFGKLPSSVKVKIIRGDKGLYSQRTIEYLESEKALFTIVAKVTRPIKWGKTYRFILIRRPIPEEPSQ